MQMMNGKGGCCIARYGDAGGGGGGGGGEMYGGMSKVDRIMLKFRPIAPKPVSAGSGSGTDNSDGYVKCVRSKRKYVRVKNTKKSKNNNDCKKRKVTLSLLPKTPARPNENLLSDLVLPGNKKTTAATVTQPQPVWVSFNNNNEYNNNKKNKDNDTKVCYAGNGLKNYQQQVVTKLLQQTPFLPQVVSYVTVECVTGTWVDVQGLGCTDEEKLMNLDKDTCPGFISDGQDRVVWTNKAYRNMAAGGDHDVSVVLIRKDTSCWNHSPPAPVMTYPAFTCKVRASTSAVNRTNSTSTITLPCDGWMMECGGYAWRLDVKAALSLGR